MTGLHTENHKQKSDPPQMKVPVLRPTLPTAEHLLPYLKRIDHSRVYSNFGPLYLELCQRLADHFQLETSQVTCANSGSSALIAAILAVAGRATKEKPLAIVPSFTFAATALAAELCGYEVVFSDVSAESWGLVSRKLLSSNKLDRVGVVIPVAPFGRPVEQSPWLDFQIETGIPVVIDGAASFELVTQAPSKYLSSIPVAMSFHATKSFSTGEGGCIMVDDPDISDQILQRLNFGFFDSRECECSSINGKMSEYHAAVGLAEFDGWQEKVAALNQVAFRYRAALSRLGALNSLVCAPEICSSYVLFVASSQKAARGIEQRLQAKGIDFRHWYGDSLHLQKHYRSKAPSELPVTEHLSSVIIGLPVAPDLSLDSIEQIAQAIGTGPSF